MSDQEYEGAYALWRASLETLVSDGHRLGVWQDQRFRFAHEVGRLLTESAAGSSSVTGPALYGVFAPGVGLCYVGQTQEAQRRLRDLPVGESHHLANTLPPEVWERVVVVRWPELVEKAPAADRAAVAELGPAVCGLALEHLLQLATSPPLNSRRRQADGVWRPRNQAASRSRGAVHSKVLPGLWQVTWEMWRELAAVPAVPGSPVGSLTDVGRVVFPASLSHEFGAGPQVP
ncbi:hypothetical protein [Streptomyces sp. NPDC051567]|uniref:hypothetical protein n=1 Tax=Streptomyces sp. NPDC051567 TaxID=3365660 RepID=UPI0037B716D8